MPQPRNFEHVVIYKHPEHCVNQIAMRTLSALFQPSVRAPITSAAPMSPHTAPDAPTLRPWP